MLVAVSAQAEGLEATADPRFGRAQWFVIVNTDTMEARSIQNTAANSMQGAGIQAAQLVANEKVEAVVAGNFGPNAGGALKAGNIKLFSFSGGTVQQAVEALKAGQLEELAGANVGDHFGMGGGGRGAGGGGGMGGGRGR